MFIDKAAPQTSIWALCGAVLGLTLVFNGACRGQDGAADLKALLKERSDVLNEIFSMVTERYQAGTVGIDTVVLAGRRSLDAAFDLTDRSDERVRVLKKLKQTGETIVRTVERREKLGVAQRFEVLQARAFVLDVRIQLFKEEQKLKPPK